MDSYEFDRTLRGNSASVLSIAISRDGQKLIRGNHDGEIIICDVDGENLVRKAASMTGHRRGVRALAILHDGRIVSGGESIRLWRQLNEDDCIELTEHTSDICSIAVSPDGWMVSGSDDKTIKVWHPYGESSFECTATLTGHGDSVLSVAIMSDGRIVSGSSDCTIKVWEMTVSNGDRSYTCQATSELHSNWVRSVAILPDDRLVSGSDDGMIRFWTVDGGVFRLTCDAECIDHGSVGVTINGSIKYKCNAIFPSGISVGELLETFNDIKNWVVCVSMCSTNRVMSVSTGNAINAFQRNYRVVVPNDNILQMERLCSGRYGEVYRAIWNNQSVAMKKLKDSNQRSSQLCDEESILRSLSHPNIVKYIGVVDGDGPVTIVMEFGENGSLHDLLTARMLSPIFRLPIAKEIASAVAYLHKKCILHRDIKSVNIVLGTNFQAKLCEFDLAVRIMDPTSTVVGPRVGTINWMAPELMKDNNVTYSASTDVWSLGMVFFELLTGQIPFKNCREFIIMYRLNIGQIETIPEKCKNILPVLINQFSSCCNIESSQRPSALDVWKAISASEEVPETVSWQRNGSDANFYASPLHTERIQTEPLRILLESLESSRISVLVLIIILQYFNLLSTFGMRNSMGNPESTNIAGIEGQRRPNENDSINVTPTVSNETCNARFYAMAPRLHTERKRETEPFRILRDSSESFRISVHLLSIILQYFNVLSTVVIRDRSMGEPENTNTNIAGIQGQRRPNISCQEFLENDLIKVIPNLSNETSGTILETCRDIANRSQDRVQATTSWTNSQKEEALRVDNDEAMALALYCYKYPTSTSGPFREINEALRKSSYEKIALMQPLLFSMFSGLEKLPVFTGIVYRGIPKCHLSEVQNNYTRKRNIQWIPYTSTSTDENVCHREEYAGNDGIIFKIRSYTGRLISPFSMSPDEKEVLFLPDTKFFVTCELQKIGDHYVVELCELDESDTEPAATHYF